MPDIGSGEPSLEREHEMTPFAQKDGPALTVLLSVGLVVIVLIVPSFSHAASVSPASMIGVERIRTCPTSEYPEYPAYDPVNHWVYVPEFGAFGTTPQPNVLILDNGCRVVGTVELPKQSAPTWAVFDPSNGDVYVTDQDFSQIYVISGDTLVQTITSPLFNFTYGIVWDPAAKLLLAASFMANRVVAISGYSVVGAVAVGTFPIFLSYDPHANEVLVANEGGLSDDFFANITGLSGANPLTGPKLSIPNVSGSIAYDPVNHDDYVSPGANGFVSVITGTGRSVASVPANYWVLSGDTSDVVWSPADHAIMVLQDCADAYPEPPGVFFVQGFHIVRMAMWPCASTVGATYDANDGRMYVTSVGGPTPFGRAGVYLLS
jgi:DNA-binding beta-propeller fold protein YncE